MYSKKSKTRNLKREKVAWLQANSCDCCSVTKIRWVWTELQRQQRKYVSWAWQAKVSFSSVQWSLVVSDFLKIVQSFSSDRFHTSKRTYFFKFKLWKAVSHWRIQPRKKMWIFQKTVSDLVLCKIVHLWKTHKCWRLLRFHHPLAENTTTLWILW